MVSGCCLTSCSNVANHFPHSLASTIVLSYHTPLPGELSHKWKPKPVSIAASMFQGLYGTRRRYRRYTLTAVISLLFQHLGAMSPSIQRFILHMTQPMIFGGLFLVGIIMRKYPLSFIAVGVAFLALVITGGRSIWKDLREEKENVIMIDRVDVNNSAKAGMHLIDQKSLHISDNDHPEKSLVGIVPVPSKLSFSDSIGDADGDNQSDRDSVTGLRRRLSSADDILATYQSKSSPTHRNRGGSVDSSTSLPYRGRGSSADSSDSTHDFIWRNVSQPGEYFNDLIISEEAEDSVEEGDNVYSDSSSFSSEENGSSSDENGAAISIVFRQM